MSTVKVGGYEIPLASEQLAEVMAEEGLEGNLLPAHYSLMYQVNASIWRDREAGKVEIDKPFYPKLVAATTVAHALGFEMRIVPGTTTYRGREFPRNLLQIDLPALVPENGTRLVRTTGHDEYRLSE